MVLILKSKKTIEWTIDTSGMDGNVLVVVCFSDHSSRILLKNINLLSFLI